jgi:hypothetical protein
MPQFQRSEQVHHAFDLQPGLAKSLPLTCLLGR